MTCYPFPPVDGPDAPKATYSTISTSGFFGPIAQAFLQVDWGVKAGELPGSITSFDFAYATTVLGG